MRATFHAFLNQDIYNTNSHAQTGRILVLPMNQWFTSVFSSRNALQIPTYDTKITVRFHPGKLHRRRRKIFHAPDLFFTERSPKLCSVEKTEIRLEREKLDESDCFIYKNIFQSKMQEIQTIWR